MKTKIRYNVLQVGVSLSLDNYNCYYTNVKGTTKTCCYCKEEYITRSEMVKYIVGNKQFCSYNCKRKFLRKQEEKEMEKLRKEFYGK